MSHRRKIFLPLNPSQPSPGRPTSGQPQLDRPAVRRGETRRGEYRLHHGVLGVIGMDVLKGLAGEAKAARKTNLLKGTLSAARLAGEIESAPQ